MATNHLLHSTAAGGRDHSRSRTETGIGLTLLALVLALTLGFSAVDIQRRLAAEAPVATSGEPERPLLDGRGKWGGYM